ncbi:hypothetical protein TSAR_013259 [Trichomalopsis sarcophagae]|uniref:U2A'/phosphoprotein 32 family A C-terminal domain-containing protein n=1 Tax=Trichomalopsis sarcophagae TaxID=543379 RepID=A0A232FLT1_9HYME|nr:hypothetical protein TSAR_013259 [Trichomalopsis sarcophagae]
MPRITMELLRKRSEHNEGEISTLEELSLHQENIERIELLNQACRNLKILLLQYNLISKIENLNKLKQLEYLNLALNNIEVIENLEGLESLKKLDLTVNFIGDIRGVKCLRDNQHLEQLILSGNPCCEYEGYREYVIASLPQIRELDLQKIDRSERIKSLQRYAEAQGDVIRGYRKYATSRETQKIRYREREEKRGEGDEEGVRITEIRDDEEEPEKNTSTTQAEESAAEDAKFWSAPSYHTPEDRVAIAKKAMERSERNESKDDEPKKHVPKLFNPEGKPYNVNQAKVPFLLDDEDDRDNVILEVGLYKHLDTSLVDVDVQPDYVRVTIKGKVLQLVLPCEVAIDKSLAQRNVTTGNLLVTMPRITKLASLSVPAEAKRAKEKPKCAISVRATPEVTKREYLEIGPPKEDIDQLLRIVGKEPAKVTKKKIVEDFVDDPDVPPLE